MDEFTFVTDCYPQCFKALGLDASVNNGCYYADTGVPTPLLNGVYNCFTNDEILEGVVQNVTQHFDENKTPHTWWVETSKEPKRLPELLSKRGMQSIGKFPAMLLKLEDYLPVAVNQEIEFQKVENASDLAVWSKIVGEAFEFSEEANRAYSAIFNNETVKGPYHHLLGSVNGQPVCTGTVLFTENGAYIYNIATAKDARNRGYALQVMAKLIRVVKERGLERVALISSPTAVNLYTGLGFKEITSYHIYMKSVWVM